MRLLFLVCCIYLGIVSCKSPEKTIELSTYEGEKITFGSGGGFTGRVTSHILLPSGNMFKKGDTSNDYVPLENIDSKIATQMFANWTALGLDQMHFDQPGNMYYFVSMTKDGKEHKLTWGDEADKKPETKVKTFYQTLRGLISEPRSQSN